jgi:hypothetical protein
MLDIGLAESSESVEIVAGEGKANPCRVESVVVAFQAELLGGLLEITCPSVVTAVRPRGRAEKEGAGVPDAGRFPVGHHGLLNLVLECPDRLPVSGQLFSLGAQGDAVNVMMRRKVLRSLGMLIGEPANLA